MFEQQHTVFFFFHIRGKSLDRFRRLRELLFSVSFSARSGFYISIQQCSKVSRISIVCPQSPRALQRSHHTDRLLAEIIIDLVESHQYSRTLLSQKWFHSHSTSERSLKYTETPRPYTACIYVEARIKSLLRTKNTRHVYIKARKKNNNSKRNRRRCREP